MTRRRKPELHDTRVDPFAAQNADANRVLVENEAPRETRGEKKDRAYQLEKLGEALVKLPAGKLARVELPDDLKEAVLEARRITAHGGYRRQIQFIGRIMRTIDARPIAAQLEAMNQEDAPSSPSFRAAERWRDRLIADGDPALAELVGQYPEADRTALRQLMRQAVVEKAKAKTQASKALFKALHALVKGAAA